MAGLIFPTRVLSKTRTHNIEMRSNEEGSKVWFDPIGIFIQPGDSIRWVIRENVHTVTAYHPDNDGHSLRIPTQAKAWNSNYLVEPGEAFEIKLSVPGVYDYYCEPHEEAGMVGRIVVGEISGPGSLAFNYFAKASPLPDWQRVPDDARKAFPSAEEIMQQKIIRL